MNKIRRKEIYTVCNKLETFKNIQASERRSNLTDIINDIEMILSDEQYYMDSIPENMQGGSKYEKAEEELNASYEAGNQEAAIYLGKVYAELGDTETAKSMYKECLDEKGYEAKAYNGIAYCCILEENVSFDLGG